MFQYVPQSYIGSKGHAGSNKGSPFVKLLKEEFRLGFSLCLNKELATSVGKQRKVGWLSFSSLF